jgi:putative transposase
MRKTFKYRLFPTKAQASALQKQLDCCRWVYNKTIEVRKDAWQNEQESLSRYDTHKLLPLWKQDEEWLKEGYAQCLVNAQVRVDLAFRAFFRRVKAGQKPGYPRFRGRDRYDSFTYPQNNRSWRLSDGGLLRLGKVGDVKIKVHRPIEGEARTLTIRRDAVGKWYACFSCIVEPKPLPQTDKVAGVDVGLAHFATLSNGEPIGNPRFFKRDQAALVKAQRRLSKDAKGSPEHRKHKRVVQHIHQRIANRRYDFAHQTSRRLINEYQLLAFEDLDIQDMQNGNWRSMNRSIQDVAWRQFAQCCSSKAEEAGRTVVFVDPRNTSKLCSGCGAIVEKRLSDRVHVCPQCGLTLDRDHNAALNILARGLACLG